MLFIRYGTERPINLDLVVSFNKEGTSSSPTIKFYMCGLEKSWCFKDVDEQEEVYNEIVLKYSKPLLGLGYY